MGLLVVIFGGLNVFMLVSGLLVNFGNSLLPQAVVQLFRYGRANMSSTKAAFITSIEVPKRWFAHFYIFAALMQLAVCVTIIGRVYFGAQGAWLVSVMSFIGESSVRVHPTIAVIASLLFLVHLSRRIYETYCVLVYSNTKMNIFHYLLAYVHYGGAILCIVAHSPLMTSDKLVDKDTFSLGVLEVISVLAFLLGNYIQHRAHVGLANLRKGKDKKKAMGHQIPRGELFEYISCPNYFGEIIIYCALACLFGLGNASWNSCTLWVICNQITSGIMNHQWYIATFKDYPKARKAVIPYIV